SGIGGQGVQLMCKALALAATRSGKYAMMAADYGGELRGGRAHSTVVLGDAPLRALPILPRTSAVVLMHKKHSEFARERLVSGGLMMINSTIVAESDAGSDARVVSIPATGIARSLGSIQTAGFVMMGAFVAM